MPTESERELKRKIKDQKKWRTALTKGRRDFPLNLLPSAPRCYICRMPFGGVGGVLMKATGRRPSRKNPMFCNMCDDRLPPGGIEMDIAVLFADVRGSTVLGERLGPTAFADLLNRFYAAATAVLVPRFAIIDKMIGDEVMALFIPFGDQAFRRNAVSAAEELLRAVGYGEQGEPWLPVGIGVHSGQAYVGKVGTEGVNDFTALGDTVNTASRLQALAKAGEIVLSEPVFADVARSYPSAEQRTVDLRGKEASISVRVLRLEPVGATKQ